MPKPPAIQLLLTSRMHTSARSAGGGGMVEILLIAIRGGEEYSSCCNSSNCTFAGFSWILLVVIVVELAAIFRNDIDREFCGIIEHQLKPYPYIYIYISIRPSNFPPPNSYEWPTVTYSVISVVRSRFLVPFRPSNASRTTHYSGPHSAHRGMARCYYYYYTFIFLDTEKIHFDYYYL